MPSISFNRAGYQQQNRQQGQVPLPQAPAMPPGADELDLDALAAMMGGGDMRGGPAAQAGPPMPQPAPGGRPALPNIYVNGPEGYALQDRGGSPMQAWNPGMSLAGGQSLVRDPNDPSRTWVSQPPNPADNTPAMSALRQMLGLRQGEALPSLAQVQSSYVPDSHRGFQAPSPYGVSPEQYAGLLQATLNGPESPTQAQARVGELGLRGVGLLGAGGVPGSLQTGAEAVRQQGIGQEMQYGPDSQFLALWEQRRRDLLANRTPPEEVDRILEEQLGRRPTIMGGPPIGRIPQPGWQNPGAGIPGMPGMAPPAAPQGPVNPPMPQVQAPGGAQAATPPPGVQPGRQQSAQSILSGIRQNALNRHGVPGMPLGNGQPGQPQWPTSDPARMRQAITAYFSNPAMTDDFLRQNFGAVHSDAINQFGGPTMDEWFQQRFYPWGNSTIPGLATADSAAHRRAVERIVAARQALGGTDLRMENSISNPAFAGYALGR